MEFIPAKTILTRVKSSGFWFEYEYNMNIYRGCNQGCIYCDSRSDCYHIEDFDRVRIKQDSLQLIEAELQKKRVKGVVGTGAMSDPYNPFEKKYQLTRGALELIDRYGFGASIATKSDLIVRDIDVLQRIAAHNPVLLKMTITTADDELCRQLEQHVVPSSKRFAALKQLHDAGLFCGILLMPILPYVNDSLENIEAIVEQGAAAGVDFIYPYFGVTMREGQREHLLARLPAAVAARYRREFGNRYECNSPNAKQLYARFKQLCDRYGILYRIADINRVYKQKYVQEQIQLF